MVKRAPAPSPEQILAQLRKSRTSLNQAVPEGKFLIFGNPGVGKTVLAFRLAQRSLKPGQKIFYIDTAEGWVSLQNHPELKVNAERFTYQGITQIRSMIQLIKDGHVEDDLDFGTCGVLIIDEYNTVADRVLDGVVIDRDKNDTDHERPGDKAEWADRDISTRLMERFNRYLLQVPGTLILVCHERKEEKKNTPTEICPDLPAATRANVIKPMHNVVRMRARQSKKANEYIRTLQCHPADMVIAKTRIGGLDVIVSPDDFIEAFVQWRAANPSQDPEPNNSAPEPKEEKQFEGIVVDD